MTDLEAGAEYVISQQYDDDGRLTVREDVDGRGKSTAERDGMAVPVTFGSGVDATVPFEQFRGYKPVWVPAGSGR